MIQHYRVHSNNGACSNKGAPHSNNGACSNKGAPHYFEKVSSKTLSPAENIT